ncbi:MAG: hypothetical protein R3Y13_00380 [bacterium]
MITFSIQNVFTSTPLLAFIYTYNEIIRIEAEQADKLAEALANSTNPFVNLTTGATMGILGSFATLGHSLYMGMIATMFVVFLILTTLKAFCYKPILKKLGIDPNQAFNPYLISKHKLSIAKVNIDPKLLMYLHVAALIVPCLWLVLIVLNAYIRYKFIEVIKPQSKAKFFVTIFPVLTLFSINISKKEINTDVTI